MAKYSKGASKKVEKVMKEKNAGTLKSGSGKKVTSRKQAIAIGLSEARKQGKKVPAAPKKAAAKKSTGKKAAPTRSAAKKVAPKKVADKKGAPKKAITSKKTAPKKAAAKSPAKKVASKKAAPKKVAIKKSAPRKATAPKKAIVKKAAPKKALALVRKAAPQKVAPSKGATPVKKAPVKKSAPKKAPVRATALPLSPSEQDVMLDDNNEISMPETQDTSDLPQADNPSGIGIPTEENTEKHIPQEEPHEPNENNPVQASHGAPVPPDVYADSKDTYHGPINPSKSKAAIKPSGKKPLWNK